MKITSWLSRLLGQCTGRETRCGTHRRHRRLSLPADVGLLESRQMLAAASVTSGELSIDFTAGPSVSENVTINNDGTVITLSGTGFATPASFSTASVSRIAVRDIGGSALQSLAMNNTVGLTLPAGFVTGGVETVSVTGSVDTVSAPLEIAANNIAIGSAANFSTANIVTLRGSSVSREINLGAENPARLSLTDAELDRISAGQVQIGGPTSTGLISVAAGLSHSNHLSLTNNVSPASGIGIEFLAGITMAPDKNLSVTALGGPRPIETFNTTVISTSGTGTLSMTANSGIAIRGGTTLTTEHGDLTLQANLSGTDAGLYSGVLLVGGIVETRGTGDVRLTGRGSLGSVSGSQIDGVRIIGTSVVRSLSAANAPTQGEIIINGVGGRGVGIYVDPFGATGDRIASNGGNITLTGQGGNAGNGGLQADGVALANGARVIANNAASVAITGVAGIGGTSRGFGLSGTVQTASGAVSIAGTGGTTTTGSFNPGIELSGGAVLSTSGSIALNGVGGSSTSSNFGIYSNSSNIRSTSGTVSVTGLAGNGTSNYALWLDNHTPIFSGVSVDAIGDNMHQPQSFFADQFSAPLVTLRPLTPGTRINVGGGDVLASSPKSLGLGDFELDRVSATTLRIGDATSGVITVVSAVTPPTDRALNVEMISGSEILFNAPYSTIGFFSAGAPTRGNLVLSPGAGGSVQPKSSTNDVVTQTNTGSAFTTSFSSGSDLRINIAGLTPHTQYDRLTASGRVNLTGADLALTGGFTSSLGNVFTIVSATNVTGTFNGQPENSFVVHNGRALRVNYTATTVTLTDVGAPVTLIPQTFSVTENATPVGTVLASPASGTETRTFSIAGSGADDHRFIVTAGGTLSFVSAPDYEVPVDIAGTPADNVYEVAVRVTDGFGFTQIATMTVTVLPVNEHAPIFTSPTAFSVAENTANVGTVTAVDADLPAQTVDYAITGGADAAQFSLADGALTFVASPDYEAPGDADADNLYEVQLTADDGLGLTTVQTIVVTVLPLNDNAPVFTSPASFTVAENSAAVGTVTATDADLPAQTATYAITGGADAAHFTVSNDGALAFQVAPDYEASADAGSDNVYEVQVTANDGRGLTTVQTVSVVVTPVNDNAPVFTSDDSATVPENTLFSHTVSATDADLPSQIVSFQLIGGADQAHFALVDGNQLQFVTIPDYEQPADADSDNVYEVEIQADDQLGLRTVQVLRVTVANANDAPVAVADDAVTDEDRSVTITVLANDGDVDGDGLTVVAVSDPAHGSALLNPDGTITYTPDADFFGVDNLVYEISDGRGGVATSTVSVNVDARPDVTFAGRIFDDRDNDGAFNGADQGLANLTVQLFDEDNLAVLVATTVTGPNGEYRFATAVEEGTYRIVRSDRPGLLDGQDAAGALGGSVDNSLDSAAIRGITVNSGAGDLVADDYTFGLIGASRLQGLVFQDSNHNGDVDFGEQAISGVSVRLTGTDDRGASVDQLILTNAQGIYEFTGLRPSSANGYTLTETQPPGYNDGLDSLGTVNGTRVGDNSTNDVFRQVVVTQPASDGVNYNFAEVLPSNGSVESGQTATIGFWQNKNGQALIVSLNGGGASTRLSNWLATTFPNLYGANAGVNNLTGMTNSQVAAFYKVLFKRTGHSTGQSGPPKADAQVLAVAFATYVTNSSLAGTAAVPYGFTVDASGLGAANFNVGSSGAAFGVANGSNVRVLDLLLAVNSRSRRGVLFDMNGDGDINDPNERPFLIMANDIFSAINETGDIG